MYGLFHGFDVLIFESYGSASAGDIVDENGDVVVSDHLLDVVEESFFKAVGEVGFDLDDGAVGVDLKDIFFCPLQVSPHENEVVVFAEQFGELKSDSGCASRDERKRARIWFRGWILQELGPECGEHGCA